MLHISLHVRATVIGRTSARSLGTLKQRDDRKKKKSFPYRVRSIKNVALVEADNERSKSGFN